MCLAVEARELWDLLFTENQADAFVVGCTVWDGDGDSDSDSDSDGDDGDVGGDGGGRGGQTNACREATEVGGGRRSSAPTSCNIPTTLPL